MAKRKNDNRTETQRKIDGWQNVLTNLGKANKDKRTGMRAIECYLDQKTIEAVYQIDDMFAKIVDRLPEDMTREGFTITVDGEDRTEEIQEIFKKYDLDSKIEEGLKWARLYGGAGAVMGVKDGKFPWEPVEFASIKTLEYITMLDRHRLVSDGGGDNIDSNLSSSNFGRPVFYRLQNSSIKINERNFMKIHNSRVIRFNGVKLGNDQMVYVDYWGDSILSRLYNVLRNFQGTHDSAATIMTDFTQLIVKLKDLADMIASGDDQLVQARLQLMGMTASIVNAIVIEEGEEAERKTTNVAGLPDMIDRIGWRLVAATEYPQTILLSQGPKGGLGSEGESEKRDYYDFVKNRQESHLRPILDQFLTFIFLAKDGPTSGKLPKWETKFVPLWQPTEKEIVETRKSQMETDKGYIEAQVLDPREVTQSRFGKGYSLETTIDTKVRKQLEKSLDNPEPVKPTAQK